MRFRLSTLLLLTAVVALSVGWTIDRYANLVPSLDVKLRHHSKLSSLITDSARLQQFHGFPDAYTKRGSEVLFTHFLNLYRDRHLFERPHGPLGDGSRVDVRTLYQIGGRALTSIGIDDMPAFERKLAESGLGAPDYFDLYSENGDVRTDLRDFVDRCLKQRALFNAQTGG